MDNKIKNTLRMGIIAAVGTAAMVSCSDTWDDHYGTAPVTDYAGTTMQAIEEMAPDFAEVIKAVGYDRELSSENAYTIWVPESFNKDSVLAVAESDPDAVIDQFIKNHVARASVTAVPGGDERQIPMMSVKKVAMVGAESFGTAKILQPNLSCTNGLIHLIDTNVPYKNNIYEMIKTLYDANPTDISLYAFLHERDSNEIDEDRSVSHGVDEDGNKIWVAPYYVFRNDILDDSVRALVYREDSNYIAIIPSAEAYKKRYEIAKSLLKFNPNMADYDSLQNYYANRFAMTDLFFNRNANIDGLTPGGDGLQYDSLKSTTFSTRTWPYNLYYSKVPQKGLHPDKELNDILSKCGEPIDCSNGVVYSVDEYPMSVTEQFFKKLNITASSSSIIRSEDNVNYTTGVLTTELSPTMTIKDYAVDTLWNEDGTSYELKVDSTNLLGTRDVRFCDINPDGNSNPKVAFQLTNTLSGTYEIYVVTCPIWAKDGYDDKTPEDNPKAYHFSVKLFERDNKGAYGTEIPMLPYEGANSDGDYFVTNYENKVDTLYLGDYTFKNAYYNANNGGVIIQLYNYVRDTNKYSREMLVSGFILRPKFEDVTEAKRK